MKKLLVTLSLLTLATSALAGHDGTATCSGIYKDGSKTSKIFVSTPFNGYSMDLFDDAKITVKINGKVSKLDYDQLNNLYVSPSDVKAAKSATFVMYMKNDGGETVMAAEFMGAGNPGNKFVISGRAVGSKQALVSLSNIVCSQTIVETID